MSIANDDVVYYCSNCKVALSYLPFANLCPNCGKSFGRNEASKADVGSPLNQILQMKRKERKVFNG